MATTNIREKSLGKDKFIDIKTDNNKNVKFGSNDSNVFIRLDDTDIMTSTGDSTTINNSRLAYRDR